tara:strand:+ start:45 stop:569 length:525 start_codon:yes stop_codon:yes gene_type:complete
MILISNHLTQLPQFKNLKNIVVRINMAHVKDREQLEQFVDVPYDVFLDYPKGRTKPPTPSLHIPDALEIMNKYKNIKYFAVSNIETDSETKMIVSTLPKHVSFIPKIETWKGVVNLDGILKNNPIKYIMLDSEDLYTSVCNDQELFLYLKDRARKTCAKNEVCCMELYGVVFHG